VLVVGLASAARAQVVINEIMADNRSIAPLDRYPDYFSDYLELYNTSANDVSLAGWTLTDDPLTNKFRFPTDTVIRGHGYLLVFCDNETGVPERLHTGFGLNNKGDRIILRKDDGVTDVEAHEFGLQVQDYSLGRVPDFTGPFQLNFPTPRGGNLPPRPNRAVPLGSQFSLRLNEWLAFAVGNNGQTNSDWFEVYNTETNAVLLSGIVFTDNDSNDVVRLRPVVPLSFIGPRGFVRFFASGRDRDNDEVDFSLSSTSAQGDELWIFATGNLTAVIDHVVLPTFPTANISRGRVPDGGTNIIQLPRLSPEESNFGSIPEILITEVLAHTDPPLEDAIELHNPTATNVNISGWWLSNDRAQPKYRVPAGTTVRAGGYKVFYEYQFNSGPNPFTLNSAHGDEVYLFKGDTSGRLLGFRRGITFGASQNGVSFGRYMTSDANVDIVAMSDLSLGTSVRRGQDPSLISEFRTGKGGVNPYPKVGPLVINEIHYHPPDIVVGPDSVDDSTNEFVEILNISSQRVLLYDPNEYRDDGGNIYANGATNTWRLRGVADFDFPTSNVSLGANRYLLVVNFDPADTAALAAFRERFKVPPEVQVFGPYEGKLSNGGGSVELYRPDPPQGPQHPDFRFVPYVEVDRVKYNDKLPWPTAADGGGASLQRVVSSKYGNDPNNWKAASPTAGAGSEAPTITLQPKSTNTVPGATVVFKVGAKSREPIQYQWQFNGTNIEGATANVLTLYNVYFPHAGEYRAVVGNSGGAVTSLVATLAVAQPQPDTGLPTVAIVAPPAGKQTTNGTLMVSGTASDKYGLAGVEYSLNWTAFQPASGPPTWATWSAPILMSPGTNWFLARSIDHAGNISRTNVRSFFYSVRAPLTLVTNGRGSVVGVSNLVQRLEIGRGYALTAKPGPKYLFSNWMVFSNENFWLSSGSPTLRFVMQSGLRIEANFVTNPFAAYKGTYSGLFFEPGALRFESSGYFTLMLNELGAYTATLLTAGQRYATNGKFDLDGRAANMIRRAGANPLGVTWHVDLTGSNIVDGTVSDGIWTARLDGDRAVFDTTKNPAPLAGRYTLIIPGTPGSTDSPEGDGYGTVAINGAGALSYSGVLADNTKVTQRSTVSKDGAWPLYAPLYSGKGLLFGWVNFDTNRPNDDLSGAVNWIKPPLLTNKLYPQGFNVTTNLVGSRYLPPTPANPRTLDLGSGVLAFIGGGLPEGITNLFGITANNRVTNGGPHALTMGFNTPSGLFSGTLKLSGARNTNRFNGVVLQKSTSASGFFLGTNNQSGRVALQAVP
jgi:hypothetical protein